MNEIPQEYQKAHGTGKTPAGAHAFHWLDHIATAYKHHTGHPSRKVLQNPWQLRVKREGFFFLHYVEVQWSC